MQKVKESFPHAACYTLYSEAALRKLLLCFALIAFMHSIIYTIYKNKTRIGKTEKDIARLVSRAYLTDNMEIKMCPL